MVLRNGSIEIDSQGGRQTIPVSHGLSLPLSVCGVSRDGRRFALRGSADKSGVPTSYAIVTITNERMRPVTVRSVNQYNFPIVLEPFLAQHTRTRTLRHKFSGICVTRNRELALVRRKRAVWPMVLDRSGKNLRLAKTPEFVPSRYLQFQDDVHNTRGYPLQRCKFPDGSLAWLDGRGLLHLRSSDRALPEATIVLGEHLLAGWLSDGRVWGPDYFHRETAVDPTQVYDEVFQPMIERMAR
jgi:hypothetical protein